MSLQQSIAQVVASLEHSGLHNDNNNNNNNNNNNKLIDILLSKNFQSAAILYDIFTTPNSNTAANKNDDTNFSIIELINDINADSDNTDLNLDKEMYELLSILNEIQMKYFFLSYDEICMKNFEPNLSCNDSITECDDQSVYVEFEKPYDRPLGFTLKMESGFVKVARIFQDSYMASRGLLSAGDIILEVNEEKIEGNYTIQDVQALFKDTASNMIRVRIIPSYKPSSLPLDHYFVQANFDYRAEYDNTLPSKSIGLSFLRGDILQILSQEDQHWWQARKVTGLDLSQTELCGLVPSLAYEERRKARLSRKKRTQSFSCLPTKKTILKHSYSSFLSGISTRLDAYELHLYTEVAQVTNFHRKTLVIVGIPITLRKKLIDQLQKHDSNMYVKPIECTNLPSAQSNYGNRLVYMPTEQLMNEMQNQKFLTITKFENYFYCIKENSIKDITDRGKICILDIEAHDIKRLKRVIFSPLIIFIQAQQIQALKECLDTANSSHSTNSSHSSHSKIKHPSLHAYIKEGEQLLKQYFHSIDVVIDISQNYIIESILNAKEAFSHGPQWVSANWVY